MSDPSTILVVDDEPEMLDVLRLQLERCGYRVLTANRGDTGLAAATEQRPDLVVLDVMMPEIDGYEVARRLRSNTSTRHIPIIMLTARADEPSEFEGFSVGVDDYVAKPASMRVLTARIDKMLDRATARENGEPSESLEVGPVRMDLDRHQAFVNDSPIELTVTESKLLVALLSAEGKVLSRPSLITRAMGPGVTVTERTIDVHITSIRKKLGEHSALIRTVRGVGYRVVAPDRVSE